MIHCVSIYSMAATTIYCVRVHTSSFINRITLIILFNILQSPKMSTKHKKISTKMREKLFCFKLQLNVVFSAKYTQFSEEHHTPNEKKNENTRNATMSCSERNSTGSKCNCLTLDSGLLLLFAQLVTLKPAKPSWRRCCRRHHRCSTNICCCYCC